MSLHKRYVARYGSADVDIDDDYDAWLLREEHEKTEILCAMADDTRIDMRNDYFRVQSQDRPSVLLFAGQGKRRNSRSGYVDASMGAALALAHVDARLLCGAGCPEHCS